MVGSRRRIVAAGFALVVLLGVGMVGRTGDSARPASGGPGDEPVVLVDTAPVGAVVSAAVRLRTSLTGELLALPLAAAPAGGLALLALAAVWWLRRRDRRADAPAPHRSPALNRAPPAIVA